MTSGQRIRIVGAGRAGGSFATALERAGWSVELLGARQDLSAAARDCQLLLLAVPDRAVAELSARIDPDRATVVAHCAGSLGLDVLSSHPHRASIHPLVALPSAELGATRLRGAWFAVAGRGESLDAVDAVVTSLEGRSIQVDDSHRAAYHAAAVVASNHLVALLGQVERIASSAGVPLEAYLELVRGTVDNVADLGPAAALTGPVARGDWETVARHRAVLGAEELAAYDAMVAAAARLSGREVPDLDLPRGHAERPR